jgi:hypothetical protein
MDAEGPACGGSAASRGRSEAELLQRVQCSAGELRAALRDRKALCLGARLIGGCSSPHPRSEPVPHSGFPLQPRLLPVAVLWCACLTAPH